MVYLEVVGLLSLLILIHELGHLVAARLAGIPVAGFSVGFGPKLWKRRYGRVEYSLRALPLGGFVTPAVDGLEFSWIPLPKRLAFFFGGPVANLLATLPIFAVLNTMERGLSAHGVLVAPFGQLLAACRQFLDLLPGLISRPDSLAGVVGIVAEGGRLAETGGLWELALSLSISLAMLNLLPIPVLDGGQITMSCLESIFPRMARMREPLTLLGMLLLAVLMIYVNVHDVIRIWL